MADHYQTDVVADAITSGIEIGARNREFMELAMATLKIVGHELAGNVRPGDRPHIAIPALIDVGTKSQPGAVLVLQDRAVVAWSEGRLKTNCRSSVHPIATISDVTCFERPTGNGSDVHQAISFVDPGGRVTFAYPKDLCHERLALVLQGALVGAVSIDLDAEPESRSADGPPATNPERVAGPTPVSSTDGTSAVHRPGPSRLKGRLVTRQDP